MTESYFDQIIEGSWENPDTAMPVGVLVRYVVIGEVYPRPRDILEQLEWSGKRVCMVCDEHTYKVAGMYLDTCIPNKIILPGDVKPTLDVIRNVQHATREARHLLAVGSGTINDICKYASTLNGQSYAVCATAPSMNGYASVNASIINKGFRTSVKAQLPSGIFMDMNTMMRAPIRLIQSGVGDVLCRSTAQADWLLSHIMLGTVYMSAPFEMLRGEEALFYRSVHKLLCGDEDAMKHLLKMLILSGLGMTLCQGSYPASQGEHMIAHTMEMVYGHQSPLTYHGEQIGVTTLTMARLQEMWMQSGDVSSFSFLPKVAVQDFYGVAYQKESMRTYDKKLAAVERYSEVWQNVKVHICKQVEPVMVSSSVLRSVLESVGAKLNERQLDWNESDYERAVAFARYSRDRWTFLDVL